MLKALSAFTNGYDWLYKNENLPISDERSLQNVALGKTLSRRVGVTCTGPMVTTDSQQLIVGKNSLIYY